MVKCSIKTRTVRISANRMMGNSFDSASCYADTKIKIRKNEFRGNKTFINK